MCMSDYLEFSIILFYVLCAILLWMYISANNKSNLSIILIKSSWLLAISFHFLSLTEILVSNNVNMSLFNALSLVGFLLSTSVLITSFFSNTLYLGLIILPINAVLFLFYNSDTQLVISDNNFIIGHIIASLISYSVLGIGATQALILKIKERQLQSNKISNFINALPSLDELDRFLFNILFSGVVLLSLSLISGLIFLDNIFSTFILHKTILSITAWMVFVLLLSGRLYYGWRGQKAANLTLIGFFVLFCSYFGAKSFVQIFF